MYQRILVGTDGSGTAAKAVARAVELAKSNKGQSRVDEAKAAHADSGVSIDTAVVDDDPVSALIDTARSGSYDLIVVGNKGMTGVGRFFHVGAVPNKLSHHLPTNLLIVRTT